VRTDATGLFCFFTVPKGEHEFRVARVGYADGGYEGTVSVTYDGTTPVRDLTLRMARLSQLVGSVADEKGEVLPGVEVTALRFNTTNGGRRLGMQEVARTDDQGRYRFTALPPGDYVLAVSSMRSTVPVELSATPAGVRRGESLVRQSNGLPISSGDGGGLDVFPSVYWPNALVPRDASVVSVKDGVESHGYGFTLHPMRGFTIRGEVRDPDGQLVPQLTLHVVSANQESLGDSAAFDTGTAITDGNGHFALYGVPRGTYSIRAVRSGRRLDEHRQARIAQFEAIFGNMPVPATARTYGAPPDKTLWVAAPISVVDADRVVDVRMSIAPQVAGRVVFAGSLMKPTAEEMRKVTVVLDPVEQPLLRQVLASGVAVDGSFETPGLLPGGYIPSARDLPNGWRLESVSLGDRDITDRPISLNTDIAGLVLRFTDSPYGTLVGQVTGATGESTEPQVVAIFPSDKSLWTQFGSTPRRLRSTITSRGGAYRLADVPPGDYMVVVAPYDRRQDWRNQAFLQSTAPSASRVSLSSGATVTLNITSGR
jgi:hypothetical protein